MKRLLAWLVILPELPAAALVSGVWNTLLLRARAWSERLPGFLQWLLEEELVDSGLLSLLTAAVTCGILWLLYRLSERIFPSRRGVRYLVYAVLSALLGVFCGYCLIRGSIPFRVPFEVEAIILVCVTAAYMLNAFFLFSAFRKKNKEAQAGRMEPISIFCFQKDAQSMPMVFAYVLGGPGLVNRHGRDKEVPGRNGARFDPDTFMRMKRAVLDEAFRGSEYLRYPLVVFSGCVSPKGDEALCTDMVRLDLQAEQFAYADLFHSSFNHNQGVCFAMDEVRKARQVRVDWFARIDESNQARQLQPPAPAAGSAPAKPAQARPAAKPAAAKPAAAKPAAAKPAAQPAPARPHPAASQLGQPLPQTHDELVHAIFGFYGTDIFDSADRLGIKLEYASDVENMNDEILKVMLKDMRAHIPSAPAQKPASRSAGGSSLASMFEQTKADKR